eukprot:2141127-Amphidinium_carterae.1
MLTFTTEEALRCLMVPKMVPGSNKIVATLSQQTPELYDRYTALIQEVKDTWRAEWESESKETSAASNSTEGKGTLLTVLLQEGDEVTLKKMKRP